MPKSLAFHHLRHRPVTLHLLFEPRDLWVGMYVHPAPDRLEIYLCVVPMLPLKVSVRLSKARLRKLRQQMLLLPKGI